MIKQFLIKNLLILHSGNAVNKLFSSFKLAAVPAVGLSISERFIDWGVSNQVFISILVGTLFVDLILGVWKHLKMSTFSFKQMILGFCQKIGIVILFYFLSEALIQIISDADLDSIYVKVALKLMLFIYLAGNSLVNMGIITNGKFPPLYFLKRIDKFNKTGDVRAFNLKNKIDENEDTNTNSPE